MTASHSDKHDLFISYASEDGDDVAHPLAELLASLGVKVWLDKFELRVGDSLRAKVDEGLSDCRFGAVVISSRFFDKHFTVRELAGLTQREVAGVEVILPIWVGVTAEYVRSKSPPLADKVAAKWEDGLAAVALQLLKVVRPDLDERLRREAAQSRLQRIRSGNELSRVIGGAHFSYLHNDELRDEAEVELVASFLQEVRDWSDIWSDIEPSDHTRAEFRLSQLLRELQQAGFSVFAGRFSGAKEVAGHVGNWVWFTAAVIRGEPAEVLHDDGKVIVMRSPT